MEGYNSDRRHETRLEAHGYSDKEKRRRAENRESKKRNREQGRFGKVNWEAYQHDQLYDMIMRADVHAMSTRAGVWDKLAVGIEETTGKVQSIMEDVMAGWHGQAAVKSAESNSRLMQWAAEAAGKANKIARGMVGYTDAVTRAQTHMPEPGFASAERNFRDGYTVTGTGGPSTAVLINQLLSDGMVSHEKARSRKAEAVRVMTTYEDQSKDVHDSMPHFKDPESTVNDDVQGWTPGPDDPQVGRPVPPTPPPTPTPPGGGTDPGSPTTAAGFADPTLAGPNPGGGPGAGPYGGGLGSLGSGGSDIVRNSPGLGGFAGGVPARGAAGVPGMLGGRPGAGMPGAFGGMPMGSSPGEEDKEHKNKYDEGMDFFDDLPPAYPSVFGA